MTAKRFTYVGEFRLKDNKTGEYISISNDISDEDIIVAMINLSYNLKKKLEIMTEKHLSDGFDYLSDGFDHLRESIENLQMSLYVIVEWLLRIPVGLVYEDWVFLHQIKGDFE